MSKIDELRQQYSAKRNSPVQTEPKLPTINEIGTPIDHNIYVSIYHPILNDYSVKNSQVYLAIRNIQEGTLSIAPIVGSFNFVEESANSIEDALAVALVTRQSTATLTSEHILASISNLSSRHPDLEKLMNQIDNIQSDTSDIRNQMADLTAKINTMGMELSKLTAGDKKELDLTVNQGGKRVEPEPVIPNPDKGQKLNGIKNDQKKKLVFETKSKKSKNWSDIPVPEEKIEKPEVKSQGALPSVADCVICRLPRDQYNPIERIPSMLNGDVSHNICGVHLCGVIGDYDKLSQTEEDCLWISLTAGCAKSLGSRIPPASFAVYLEKFQKDEVRPKNAVNNVKMVVLVANSTGIGLTGGPMHKMGMYVLTGDAKQYRHNHDFSNIHVIYSYQDTYINAIWKQTTSRNIPEFIYSLTAFLQSEIHDELNERLVERMARAAEQANDQYRRDGTPRLIRELSEKFPKDEMLTIGALTDPTQYIINDCLNACNKKKFMKMSPRFNDAENTFYTPCGQLYDCDQLTDPDACIHFHPCMVKIFLQGIGKKNSSNVYDRAHPTCRYCNGKYTTNVRAMCCKMYCISRRIMFDKLNRERLDKISKQKAAMEEATALTEPSDEQKLKALASEVTSAQDAIFELLIGEKVDIQ